MIIIGCDYHPGFEQIAFVDTETGELQERRLQHKFSHLPSHVHLGGDPVINAHHKAFGSVPTTRC